jgi:predicted AAA+ superfamily ATPase
VIDEVQRKPEIFDILRVLADRRPLPAQFGNITRNDEWS